jgi:acetyl esterase/lipase
MDTCQGSTRGLPRPEGTGSSAIGAKLKKTPSIAYLIAALLVASIAKAATPFVLDLWPGKPPGDLPTRGAEKTFAADVPKYGKNLLITNVTKPTLTVYPPPGRNCGTAVIICPGGGYWNLFWDKEGEQVAAWLNVNGMTGIILKYRVPRPPNVPEEALPMGPQMDAQRAVRVVRRHAAEWGINAKRIGMVGFSMGAHLSAATATNFEKRAYEPIDAIDEEEGSRPDFAILCYPDWLTGAMYGKSANELSPAMHIPRDTPPMMLVHASDDSTSPSDNSAVFYLALKRAGIPAELHIFATGEHDFGAIQDGSLPSSWPGLCIKWLKSQDLLEIAP